MRLETTRLYIRRLHETDWQEMKNIFTDFNNSRYAIYDMPLPTEDKEVQSLTKRFAESNLFFAVFLKESRDMLGYVCFHKEGTITIWGIAFILHITRKVMLMKAQRALLNILLLNVVQLVLPQEQRLIMYPLVDY